MITLAIAIGCAVAGLVLLIMRDDAGNLRLWREIVSRRGRVGFELMRQDEGKIQRRLEENLAHLEAARRGGATEAAHLLEEYVRSLEMEKQELGQALRFLRRVKGAVE